MSLVVSHRGTKLTVPLPVIAPEGGNTFGDAVATTVDVDPATALAEDASTNADGGNPPIVSASAAFSAYGTLSSRTRGCSSPPLILTPNQCASPLLKRSSGKPSVLVAPSCTV